MNWHRIHYTASLVSGQPVEGVIDVLGDAHSWAAYCTIVRRYPLLDYRAPIEVTPLGESDGSLAGNSGPRDDTEYGVPFQIRGSR